MKTTKNLKIYGRVQGVFFRASMCQQAAKLEITGWVRNQLDGSVEAMLQGYPTAVESMIEWAYQGPLGAQVARVEITVGNGEYNTFSSLPTQ